MKVKRILFLFLVLVVVSFTSVNAFANVETENVAEEPVVEMIRSTSIEKPTCVIVRYYCGVQYQWTSGSGADDMSLTDNAVVKRLIGATYYQECSTICSSYSKNICPPWHNSVAASYYSSIQTYSDYSFVTDFNNGQYGKSLYATDLYFDPTTSSEVPCDIDQTNFIWKHGGTSAYTIYGTVQYNRQMVNVVLEIPFLGYKSTTFTVGNQSFVLRTGPNKVSIRANSSSNIPVNDFAFAFVVRS